MVSTFVNLCMLQRGVVVTFGPEGLSQMSQGRRRVGAG